MKKEDVVIGSTYMVCNGSQKIKGCYCIVRGTSKKLENAFVVTMISGALIHHTIPMLSKDFKLCEITHET